MSSERVWIHPPVYLSLHPRHWQQQVDAQQVGWELRFDGDLALGLGRGDRLQEIGGDQPALSADTAGLQWITPQCRTWPYLSGR